ncbi:MAG: hypothetical protein Q8R37_03640 [Nanoarchaeota archaeon]|nr:hypothetical protein [Nanoarchaeota archaeon]
MEYPIMTMTEDYRIETTARGVELNRDNVENYTVMFWSGKCAADKEDWRQPRGLDHYIQNVLTPMITSGEIDDGSRTPYDDRKFRFDKAEFSRPSLPILNISLGATHFKAVKEDIERSNDENKKLQQRGYQKFGDCYAFFARSVGVAVLPITSDGTVFVGERKNTEYGGFLNAVAGYVTFRKDVSNLNIKGEALRELNEEFGISKEEVTSLDFAGIYSHPMKGDLDFTFIAKVNKPEEYFSSGAWMATVKEREHKPLVHLASMSQIEELLETGKLPNSDRKLKVMYSTRGALMSIRAEEIRS